MLLFKGEEAESYPDSNPIRYDISSLQKAFESLVFEPHSSKTTGLPKAVNTFTEKIVERNVPKASLSALDEKDVRTRLKQRLKVWNLDGDWTIEGSNLVIASSSPLNAKRCLHILTQTVHTEQVFLRKEYIRTIRTSKWADFLKRTEEESVDKVFTCVNSETLIIGPPLIPMITVPFIEIFHIFSLCIAQTLYTRDDFVVLLSRRSYC